MLTAILFAGASGCGDCDDADDGSTAVPRFESAECSVVAPFSTKSLPTPPVLMESRCGYLVVPENRTMSNGRTIRLAVIIVPSVSQPLAPDPVVFLAGGPGGSALIEIEPSTGRAAAPTLTNSTVLAFPGVGHTVIQSSPCAQEVFASFRSDPAAPDTACVAEFTPPPFNTGE